MHVAKKKSINKDATIVHAVSDLSGPPFMFAQVTCKTVLLHIDRCHRRSWLLISKTPDRTAYTNSPSFFYALYKSLIFH